MVIKQNYYYCNKTAAVLSLDRSLLVYNKCKRMHKHVVKPADRKTSLLWFTSTIKTLQDLLSWFLHTITSSDRRKTQLLVITYQLPFNGTCIPQLLKVGIHTQKENSFTAHELNSSMNSHIRIHVFVTHRAPIVLVFQQSKHVQSKYPIHTADVTRQNCFVESGGGSMNCVY